jgi:hypothetical protein
VHPSALGDDDEFEEVMAVRRVARVDEDRFGGDRQPVAEDGGPA